MSDLVAFLNARLDEDEAAAKACADNDGNLGWRDSPVLASPGDHTIRTTGSRPVARIHETDSRGDRAVPRILSPDAVAAHIARQDPARTLREVAAKRAILDQLATDLSYHPPVPPGHQRAWAIASLIVEKMAAVYSDHPDYDPAWAMGSAAVTRP